MTEVKDTPQTGVEKKFKDVFGRSPGPFPEGASLKEKVNYIAKGTRALKAIKSKELEDKMRNVAKLNKEFEKQQRQNNEEIGKLRRLTQELKEEFGYTVTNKRSRLDGNDKSSQKAGQIAEASTQTPSRAEGLRDNPEFQEAASNLKETATEGEKFGQKKTSEVSVQTDEQAKTPPEHDASSSVSENSVGTLGRATVEDKSFEQKKTSEVSVQTDGTPSERDVGFSLNRNLKMGKSNNKKLEQDEKNNAPQENQKEEGLFSFLKRSVKKVLEKLLGEDKKGVESTHNMEGAVQKNTLNNEMQQKSISQSSYVNINGKEFNLEPEKSFNYQDKALNISITYIGIVYISPEIKQNLQQDTASPNIANVINLNISGKEYSVQPGESFNYKSPGLEISVVNGRQQSKHFDNILSQNRTISKGLEQVTTQLENSTITPVNTPEVDKISAGRER